MKALSLVGVSITLEKLRDTLPETTDTRQSASLLKDLILCVRERKLQKMARETTEDVGISWKDKIKRIIAILKFTNHELLFHSLLFSSSPFLYVLWQDLNEVFLDL